MKSRLIKIIFRLKITRELIKASKPRKYLLNLSGFRSDRIYTYPNFKKDKKYFITDYDRHVMYYVNKRNQQLFTQLNSYLVFSHFVDYARVYGVIYNNEFYSYTKTSNILDCILSLDKFVLKNIYSGKGVNVYVITKLDQNTFLVNDRTYDINSLETFIKSKNKYILQEYITQHSDINKIYNGSTNTLRVVTLRDPHTKDIFIGWGALRIGNEYTAPVDNFSAGGMSSLIDLKTGELSEAKWIDRKEKRIITLEKHFNSGEQIKGFIIPHWNIIKNDLILSHSKLIEINLIAWDVVVTEKKYKIIEVNNTTSLNHIQVHYPLLKDKKILSFFNYYKKKRR